LIKQNVRIRHAGASLSRVTTTAVRLARKKALSKIISFNAIVRITIAKDIVRSLTAEPLRQRDAELLNSLRIF
jgi:hypothetical protein